LGQAGDPQQDLEDSMILMCPYIVSVFNYKPKRIKHCRIYITKNQV
jgi:hypothetical protein